MWIIFHVIYGMSSFPFTYSYFSEGLKPPTSDVFIWCLYGVYMVFQIQMDMMVIIQILFPNKEINPACMGPQHVFQRASTVSLLATSMCIPGKLAGNRSHRNLQFGDLITSILSFPKHCFLSPMLVVNTCFLQLLKVQCLSVSNCRRWQHETQEDERRKQRAQRFGLK